MSTIRRQVSIDASSRTIWQALTTPDGLRAWLVDEARVDARPGGRLVVKLKGQEAEDVGLIHVYRPTGRLEIHWDKAAAGPWSGGRTAFQIAVDGGETVVNVQHLNPAFEDVAVRAVVDSGWKDALLRLRDGLEAG